jgi:tripartite-type tricarboxylate transporter receptor subunit TctC
LRWVGQKRLVASRAAFGKHVPRPFAAPLAAAISGDKPIEQPNMTNHAFYPTKPVRLIEPFGVGGGVDVLAGSAGIGTGTHLGVEEFNLEARITTTHMPPSPSDAITDTIARTVAGRTDYMLAPIPSVLPAIHGGELVALGVSTERRSRLLPEVPTISEAGVPDFDFPIWYGV